MTAVVLFSAAITVVFVKGSLFDPLRRRGPARWRELASCALCAGVWVGMALGLILGLWRGFSAARGALEVLSAGALTGATALLYVRLTDWLDSSAAARDSESVVAKLTAEQKKHEVARTRVREALGKSDG